MRLKAVLSQNTIPIWKFVVKTKTKDNKAIS